MIILFVVRPFFSTKHNKYFGNKKSCNKMTKTQNVIIIGETSNIRTSRDDNQQIPVDPRLLPNFGNNITTEK